MTGSAPGRISFAQEDLSLAERMLRVLYAPRSSFEAVVGRESALDWLAPLLVVCAVGLLSHQLTIDLITDLENPAVQERMARMSDEERDQYTQNLRMLRTHGWMMVPIGVFTSLAVVSVVLLAVGRSVLKGEVSYRQMLVVKAYASLVLVPEWIVRTLLVLGSGSAEVHTGLGAFVPAEMAGTFAGRLLISFNLFDAWQVGVAGIGLSVTSGASSRRAVATLLILWTLWLVGSAAIESAAPTFPKPS